MNVVGIEFSGYGIALLGMLIATLDHKLVYNTVKIGIVILICLDELYKVCTVQRRILVKL